MDKYLHMKRKYRGYLMEEYFCALTRELDSLAGFKEDSLFKHYVLVDEGFKKDKRFPIRIPGGTVGGMSFDDNGIVTAIHIDTNYVVHSYPKNVNEIIQKYIGYKIELHEGYEEDDE